MRHAPPLSAKPPPVQMQRQHQPPRQQQQQQQQRGGTTDVVMYVWGGEGETSSERALDLAERNGIMPMLTVVDVRDLRFSETPDWLVGVPTVLTVQDETIYKGTAALRKIEEMAKDPQQYTRKQMDRQPLGGGIQQQIEGVGTMQHRSPMMMRGMGDDALTGQPPAPTESRLPSMMKDDTKVSAADMQSEIDEILKRREQMMSQPQEQGNQQPLPSMAADA